MMHVDSYFVVAIIGIADWLLVGDTKEHAVLYISHLHFHFLLRSASLVLGIADRLMGKAAILKLLEG